MSEGMNRVFLLGNLGADPELRVTQGGTAVLSLRLATTETYLDRDKQRVERTDWHSVVIWGKRGEALAKILAKGSSILIEGSIRTSSYEDRDGNKRYKTEIVASNVLLTGGRGRGGSAGGDDAGDGDSHDRTARPVSDPNARGRTTSDRGRGSAGSAARPAAASAPVASESDDGDSGGGDEDIPF